MSWTRRYEEAEPQRVNRWLAQSGVCSRREADDLIARGLVAIDGARVEDAGRKIAPGQTLTLAQAASSELAQAFTAVLNKPVGFVSGQPEADRSPAVRLLTREASWGEVTASAPAAELSLPPLGRLDMDSRGLLLLSNDGVLAKALIGPASKLDKEYVVRVEGPVTNAKVARLRFGLKLDGRELKRAQVDRLGAQVLRFVLREGRNRQIRRMCERVGLHVVDLHRVRIGPLHLGDLPEGRWRPLCADERGALIGAAG